MKATYTCNGAHCSVEGSAEAIESHFADMRSRGEKFQRHVRSSGGVARLVRNGKEAVKVTTYKPKMATGGRGTTDPDDAGATVSDYSGRGLELPTTLPKDAVPVEPAYWGPTTWPSFAMNAVGLDDDEFGDGLDDDEADGLAPPPGTFNEFVRNRKVNRKTVAAIDDDEDDEFGDGLGLPTTLI